VISFSAETDALSLSRNEIEASLIIVFFPSLFFLGFDLSLAVAVVVSNLDSKQACQFGMQDDEIGVEGG